MCYYVSLKANPYDLKGRFDRSLENDDEIIPTEFLNGFSYPHLPIITQEHPELISTRYTWGFVPEGRETFVRKNLLNARIETVENLPSFASYANNRCLVACTGYYEWRWLDEKGKKKEKYIIHSSESEIFTFAGIYASVPNKNGELMNTFAILTTEANPFMEYVHNHKKRMPVILKKADELSYLNPATPIESFAYPYDGGIVGFSV